MKQAPGPACIISYEKKRANTQETPQKCLPAAATMGNKTPPAGGSEVLQADEYIYRYIYK